MADSSTGGYLTPSDASPPLEDAALESVMQKLIVGISGLPGNMVRPRWQPTVPKQPEANENWCAFGITEREALDYPALKHDPAGFDVYTQHFEIRLLATFYGPKGAQYASQLHDGLYVPQNAEQLKKDDIGVVEAGSILSVPEFVNQQWIRRYDMHIVLRRKVTRIYSILNIESAGVTVHADTPLTTTINITP